jgi:peptidoglycan/xylan/chitin deacetylase (PgdA/CDA1 family)
MSNPIAIALKGKGLPNLLKRSLAIGRRYGLTPAKMDHRIKRFARILEEFECGATFPLTAQTLTRSKDILSTYQNRGIEYAVHGYYHVDYSQLSLDQQLDHLSKARQMFGTHHLGCNGFRCPYLRWNQDTLTALGMLNFGYDSSQALAWDVVDGVGTETYHQVLDFYGAQSAVDYPALPRLEDNLVRIPYCLPDDEALVERLQLTDTEPMAAMWSEILRRTYESGELFTLGLHPERIAACEGALRAVLSQARSLSPTVWIARLDEMATWWRSRTETTYQVVRETRNSFRLTVNGPPGTTILARSVVVEAPTEPWMKGYRCVKSNDFVFQADRLPFIGLSPDTPSALISFLQQQGYLVETDADADAQSCAFHLNRTDFAPEDERPLLEQVEKGTWPLLRLARWPHGAQSALSITGDIDALTLWDYVLRVFD